jgi:DNA-binding MarR family transcriptional regulator
MQTISTPCRLYSGERYHLAESVGHQLFCLVNLMRRVVEARMAEHGLTDSQWKPLWLIKSGIADTSLEMARQLNMDAGAVTRMVDRVVAKGLVERVRSESDRRVVHLRLTPAGETAAAEVPHVLAAVNNDFLRGFSESEWKQLQKLLSRMGANGMALLERESAEA